MTETITDEQRNEEWLERQFGTLDAYFSMMMTGFDIPEDELKVYELAVRAFINDIAHNGLPVIRRERYNRELGCSIHSHGLQDVSKRMKAQEA